MKNKNHYRNLLSDLKKIHQHFFIYMYNVYCNNDHEIKKIFPTFIVRALFVHLNKNFMFYTINNPGLWCS